MFKLLVIILQVNSTSHAWLKVGPWRKKNRSIIIYWYRLSWSRTASAIGPSLSRVRLRFQHGWPPPDKPLEAPVSLTKRPNCNWQLYILLYIIERSKYFTKTVEKENISYVMSAVCFKSATQVQAENLRIVWNLCTLFGARKTLQCYTV